MFFLDDPMELVDGRLGLEDLVREREEKNIGVTLLD